MTLIEDLIRQASILSEQTKLDHLDEELVMNSSTWNEIKMLSLGNADEKIVPRSTLFDLPVVILDELPDGRIHRRPRASGGRTRGGGGS